jgi:hypothetical protein
MTKSIKLAGFLLIVALSSVGSMAVEHHAATVTTATVTATQELAKGVWMVAVELLGFGMAGRDVNAAPGVVAPQSAPKMSSPATGRRPAHHRLRELVRQADGSAGQDEGQEVHPAVE